MELCELTNPYNQTRKEKINFTQWCGVNVDESSRSNRGNKS